MARSTDSGEAPGAKTLEQAFADARAELRSRYGKNNVSEAIRAIEPIMSASTIRLCYSDDEAISVKPQSMRRLIWLFSDAGNAFIYDRLAQFIGQSRAASADHILSDLLAEVEGAPSGKYVYFRYYADSDGMKTKLKLVQGHLHFFESGGLPVFHHRSHNYTGEGPEHSGFVFLSGGKLFLFAHRLGTLRLGITKPISDKAGGVMHGLVLSGSQDNQKTSFAARFVMVHEVNRRKITELADESPLSAQERENLAREMERHGITGLPGETVGEEAFFKAADNSRYAFYLMA